MLENVSLDQMRFFVAVAETGSFRIAAERLRRAQSAVSQAIRNIEQGLETTLIERTGTPVGLTPAGRIVLADAREILAKVDAMRSHARSIRHGVEPCLTIAVDPLFPIAVLSAALKHARDQFKDVEINLLVLPLEGPLASLRSGEAMLAFTVGELFSHPLIELELVGRVAFPMVASAGHPLASQSEISAKDLFAHAQIVLADPGGGTSATDYGVLAKHRVRVNTLEGKLALILDGVGWGRLPHWMIERHVAAGTMRILPVFSADHLRDTRLSLFMARRSEQEHGPVARKTCDQVRHLLEGSDLGISATL